MNRYDKLKISLRYWLLGMSQSNPDYLKCVDALEYAAKIHTGTRKDGVTPEFEHQLVITHYLRTLINTFEYPVETICASLLHDIPEDYDVGFDEITSLFGITISVATEKLTKFHRGHKKTNEEYFEGISNNPISSLVKGGDRIHNLQSMIGVFSKEKQEQYIIEAEQWILPAIKKARKQFSKQEPAYQNIKLLMESQIQLIKSTW